MYEKILTVVCADCSSYRAETNFSKFWAKQKVDVAVQGFKQGFDQ